MKKLLKVLATAIAVVGGLFILILIGDLIFAGWLYSWFFTKVQGFGILPGPITTLVAVWCAALTFLQAPKVLREFTLRKHERLVLRTAGLLTAWFLLVYAMAHPPANWFFNPFSGKALFKYAKTPDGTIKLYPIGYGFNVDPTTGSALSEITPSAANEYLKQRTAKGEREPEESHPQPAPTTLASSSQPLVSEAQPKQQPVWRPATRYPSPPILTTTPSPATTQTPELTPVPVATQQVRVINVRMEPVESRIKNDPANPVIYLWVTKIELSKTSTILTVAAKSSDPQRGCYLYPPTMQSRPNDPPSEPRFQAAYLVNQDGAASSFTYHRGVEFTVYPTTSWTQQFVHYIPPAVVATFQLVFESVGDADALSNLKLYYDQFGLMDVPLPK